jgi:hypothetical protein
METGSGVWLSLSSKSLPPTSFLRPAPCGLLHGVPDKLRHEHFCPRSVDGSLIEVAGLPY